MVVDAILDATARHDIVLDGFLGSESMGIAAERCGKRCYVLELDSLYVDTVIRRWQRLTQGSARQLVSGRSFAESEEEVDKDGGGRRQGTRTTR